METQSINRKFNDCLLFIPNFGVTGGVSYDKSEYTYVPTENNTEQTEWKTTRFVSDKEEHAESKRLKERFRRRFARLGASIRAGFVVRLDKETDLEETIADTKTEIKSFNRRSVYSRFYFYPVKVYIDSTNSNIMTATAQQLSDLLKEVKTLLLKGDYDAVRKRLKGINTTNYSEVFSGETSDKIAQAFKRVRTEARALARAQRNFDGKRREGMEKVNTAEIDIARAAFIELISPDAIGVLTPDDVPQVDIKSAASIEVGEGFM